MLSMCLQCGCVCGWTTKRYALPELQKYCRVSTTQEQHTGHGPDAKLPRLMRRGTISSDCRGWIADLVLVGLSNDEVIKRVRAQVQKAFADDPWVDGGLEVCNAVMPCCLIPRTSEANDAHVREYTSLKCLVIVITTAGTTLGPTEYGGRTGAGVLRVHQQGARQRLYAGPRCQQERRLSRGRQGPTVRPQVRR